MAVNLVQPEPFVDADTVAAFLSIKRRQVLELARSGRIPAHPLLGSRRKVWRFRLSEVDAAVVSGIRQPPIPSNGEALAEAIPPGRMPCGSPRSQKGKL
ncbi:MAG TPA: helix-turn-helix domain-containing protein [Candidatus Acidoferrum sp.]|nr:helix-turn-helix domain-containing protein [Candidatus Acidoferrum sp.]